MPEGTKRIVWKHKADTLSKIELERLIDHLQAQEQDGGNVSYDLYHLTKYAELKGLYLQEGLLNGK